MRNYRIISFLLFTSVFGVKANTGDSLLAQLKTTHVWNLADGDSLVVFESRMIYYTPGTTTTNTIAPTKDLFPKKNAAKPFSQTSKFVIRKNGADYTLTCYLSDRDRYPNYKFDRQMKKEKYWHFKKYLDKKLSEEDVKELCVLEKNCTDHAMDKYDEGDISKSMTVIKQHNKEICSSYRAASEIDLVVVK